MTTIDQLTQDLATAQAEINALKSDVNTFMIIANSTANELIAAQAEIARLRDLLERAQNGLKWYQDEHPDDASEADGELHVEIDEALSQPSPSLQEYRDKVIEECADVAFQFGKKYSSFTGNKNQLVVRTAYMAASATIYDAIRELKS